jgi:hypothetical protein
MRPRVLIVPRTSWPSTARLCVSAWTSAPAQNSSQKSLPWPMSATHNGLSSEGRGAASRGGRVRVRAMGFAHACASVCGAFGRPLVSAHTGVLGVLTGRVLKVLTGVLEYSQGGYSEYSQGYSEYSQVARSGAR